MSFLFLAVT